MFKIFLPILLLIIVPCKAGLAETWEEFQSLKAAEEHRRQLQRAAPK